jgi:hypothetical protein
MTLYSRPVVRLDVSRGSVGHVQLRNPDDSGKTLRVKQIWTWGDNVEGFVLGYTTMILGNPSFPTPNGLKVDPNATGPAYGHGSTRHDVTNVGDEVQIGQMLSIGGAGMVTIPDIGIVLPPGRNLLIRNVYSAGSRTATFLWDEV